MRAQLEQAKEEKRRKQVLAERKAQNVEATMRFQKGVKYFRSNRGKIQKLFNSPNQKTAFLNESVFK